MQLWILGVVLDTILNCHSAYLDFGFFVLVEKLIELKFIFAFLYLFVLDAAQVDFGATLPIDRVDIGWSKSFRAHWFLEHYFLWRAPLDWGTRGFHVFCVRILILIFRVTPWDLDIILTFKLLLHLCKLIFITAYFVAYFVSDSFGIKLIEPECKFYLLLRIIFLPGPTSRPLLLNILPSNSWALPGPTELQPVLLFLLLLNFRNIRGLLIID